MNEPTISPSAKPRHLRRTKLLKVILGSLGILLVVLVTPALTPPGRHDDPAPYFASVKLSAALPPTRGDTPKSGDLIIRRARIVDANGVRGPTNVRIEAGRIASIAQDVGTGPTELDIAGATLMPGIIDAHVHLSLTPGGLTRGDDPKTTRLLRLHHLRAQLGLSEQVGTVEIGKAADLVVVQEDPLVDMERAMQSLQYMIRAGVARTPDLWMANQ